MKILSYKNIGMAALLVGIVLSVVYLYNSSQNELVENDSNWNEVLWEGGSKKIEIVYDYDTLSAKLRATDSLGRKTEAETAYGVDDVITIHPDKHIIVTIGREADRLVDFDFLQEVMFQEEGPVIETIVEGPAFGGYYKQDDIIYIPQTDVTSQLKVIIFPEYEWNFGEEITNRSDWKEEYWLAGVHLLPEHELILEFAGNCDGVGKPPICARYLMSAEGKVVTPLPPPPSTVEFYSVGDKVGNFILREFAKIDEDAGGGYQARFTGVGRVTGTLSHPLGVFTGWQFMADTPSMLPNARTNYHDRAPWFIFDSQSEKILDSRYETTTSYRQTIEISGFTQDIRPMETADMSSLVRVIQSEPIPELTGDEYGAPQ